MNNKNKIVLQSFVDAEALEMICSYGLSPGSDYEFMARQEDYYISIIGAMHYFMNHLFDEHISLEEKEKSKRALLNIAKGLLVYSYPCTKSYFRHVNQFNNTLFVAAIYYICCYEAIASLLLKNLNMDDLETLSAKISYYIISGACAKNEQHERYIEGFEFVDNYVLSGDLSIIDSKINELLDIQRTYSSPIRDYFDTQILLYVLYKFKQNNLWSDLLLYDSSIDWKDYILYSKQQHILSFLPSQQAALENGLLQFDRSFSLAMPTSAGKSYITELLIYQELRKNPQAKILYLAPLRSLSRELKEHYRFVAQKLNFKVASKYGGNVSDIEDANISEAQLLIATPETYITLETILEEQLNEFSLIICDEGQLLDDYSRGINYELLLTRLRQIPGKRFLFISAIIPNITDVNEWLGGNSTEVADSTYRPCKQRFGTLHKQDDTLQICIYNSNYDQPLYNIDTAIVGIQLGPREKCSYAARQALMAGSVMVFSTNKKWCISNANNFLSLLQKKVLQPIPFHEKLIELIEYTSFQLGENYLLVSCIKNGFAFHNADLPQDIRELIENAIEQKVLQLIFCTSTLAEGVNMPIKTLILCHLNNPVNYKTYISRAKIKNIIGRVGRTGKEIYGTILMPDDKQIPIQLVCDALKNKNIDPIKGTLYDLVHYLDFSGESIDDWIRNEELMGAVDTMITKSSKNNQLNDINIEDLIQQSLAYKFSNENQKVILEEVFKNRYNYLRENINDKNYEIYKQSGLSIIEIERLEHLLTPDIIDLYKNESIVVTVDEFVDTLIPILLDITQVQIKYEKDKIFNIVRLWMHGEQYWKIAQEISLDVTDVLAIIKIMSEYLSVKCKSVITYICLKYEGNLSRWDNVSIYLKYGICTTFQYYLLNKRLSNRIAIHFVGALVIEYGWHQLDYDMILPLLVSNSHVIMEDLKTRRCPVLVIEKIMRWLEWLK